MSEQPPPETPVGRVLVVDDEVDLRVLTARRVSRAGYDVAEARDGEEAWELMVAGPAPVALVLDVRMPRLDGIGLTRRIRDSGDFDDVSIVLLTASVEEHQQAAGTNAGADAYLRKPCTTEQLLSALREAIDTRASRAGGADA